VRFFLAFQRTYVKDQIEFQHLCLKFSKQLPRLSFHSS